MDYYLKKILAFVYYGSIVNNRPKKFILLHVPVAESDTAVHVYVANNVDPDQTPRCAVSANVLYFYSGIICPNT